MVPGILVVKGNLVTVGCCVRGGFLRSARASDGPRLSNSRCPGEREQDFSRCRASSRAQGGRRRTHARHLAAEALDLAPVEEQLARAERLVVENVRLRAYGLMRSCSASTARRRAGGVGPAMCSRRGSAAISPSEPSDSGAIRLDFLEHLVLKARLPVARNDVLARPGFFPFALKRRQNTQRASQLKNGRYNASVDPTYPTDPM